METAIICILFAQTIMVAASFGMVIYLVDSFKRSLQVETASTKSLATTAFSYLSARSATEAVEAKAYGDKAAVEVEMLQAVLREQQQKAKRKEIETPAAPNSQNLIVDGRELEPVSIDDILGDLR